MCILFIHTNPNPKPGGYRLILASNRDEYYARPAKYASLDKETKIIGGKDLEKDREGGMWLGLSLKQLNKIRCRIGALLNIPGEQFKDDTKYRGIIVQNYLNLNQNAEEYVQYLRENGEYRPHNFVAVELSDEDAKIYHNCSILKDNGLNVYSGMNTLGFGNCTVDIPLKKVVKGRERFKNIVEDYDCKEKEDKLIQELLMLLKWNEKHLPDEELQKRNPMAFEGLSSVFVNIEKVGYGSRAHTLILIDDKWNAVFIEEAIKDQSDLESIWNKEVLKAQL